MLTPAAALKIVLFALAVVATPAAAFAWGCDGHQAVALIAYQQLNPRARAAADQLLQQLPQIPVPSHFCAPSNTNPFVDVSTWADDIRSIRPETAPWHFIDVPLSVKTTSPKAPLEGCPPDTGCIVTAITQEIATLRDFRLPPADRAMALLFLIHFVGDLHQPLHTTTNNDRGGNCLPVAYMGSPSREGANENYSPNLHLVWDVQLVQSLIAGRPLPVFAAYLQSKYASSIAAWLQEPFDLRAWVWEGHQLAARAASGQLATPVPVEQHVPINLCSDDDHVSQRLAQLHENVDQTYAAAVAPAIEVQLTKAGARLAAILNSIWP